MSPATEHRTLGIDLGTTFVVAYLDDAGKPITISNAEGELTTASVVLFERDGTVVVGREAKAAALLEPQIVADFIKREMGEPAYSRRIHGKSMSPATMSGLILKKLRQDAEVKIGPVSGAVITVPAYFDEARRQATVAAGKIAGLKVLDILNEPTAAALAYAFRDFLTLPGQVITRQSFAMAMESKPPHTAIVYDLGGGTFDVTVLRINGATLSVLATDGDVRLGGHDWDMRIADHAADLFKQAHGKDPRTEPQSLQALMTAAEHAKRNLSLREQTRFAINHDGHTLTVELSRAKFDEMTADLLYRTERRLSRVLEDAGLKWHEIDQVLPVGGSTRMPQVLSLLQRVTGRVPNSSLAPDEVVAHGAAIHAAIRVAQSQAPHAAANWQRSPAPPTSSETAPIDPPAQPDNADNADNADDADDADEQIVLLKDADDDLPVLELDDAAEVNADEPIVLDIDEAVSELASPPEEGIVSADDALEVVAEPAAGSEADNDLTGVLQAINTINVNAHSLGVVMKTRDNAQRNSIIIPRNTPLPTSVTRRYGTVVDNQTAVTVKVVEGESNSADDCIAIGKCQIRPLPWGLRKGSTIYVTFSYDNSGRLHVKAVEATTGSQAATLIERQAAVDPQQIEEQRRQVEQTTVT